MRYLMLMFVVLMPFSRPRVVGQPLHGIASHPRLLADSADCARARTWLNQSAWYRSIVEEQKVIVNAFIDHGPIYVSPIKQTYQYKMYTCPEHDVELLYEEFSPFRHRCPRDTSESYAGGKYDASWAGWYNRELATHLVWMGILYQLEGDERYADAGRGILLQFAELYLRYPTDNTILGPAHVFFGTLSESFWGVDMAYGYDLLYNYPGFTDVDRAMLKDQLFIPLARITQRFPETASNRQLWYNNVSAAVGFLYGEQDLIDFALEGQYGFSWQLGSALPESGFWPEWSGYHFVALRGMIHLAEMARHNGLDLYHMVKAGRSMKAMFDAPFDVILPNLEFPRSKDSGGGNLIEYASFYEVGYAVYGDWRYAALIALAGKNRGAQVAGETSALGRSRSPITMFNLVAEIPRDTADFYPGTSTHLTGTGFAALRNGSGPSRRYLYLDYGIMGGEHGHPDRLQIGYYARGLNWIVDPLNESYFNPNLQLWYRQTIAHNTLVVDQTSQSWANGEPVFYGALPGLQVAAGRSETVYPGTALTRTVIQAGDYALDLFDAVSDEPRTFDWPLHAMGQVAVTGVNLRAEPDTLFGPEPRYPGYDQLRDVRSGAVDSGWQAVFEASGGEKLTVLGIGEPGTRLFTAMTPPRGGFYKQMVADRSPLPMVMSRRHESRTRFAHLIHAWRETAHVLSLSRDAADGAYRIVLTDCIDRIVADSAGESWTLVRRTGGRPTLLSGFNIKEVRDGNVTLLSSPSLLSAFESRWQGTTLMLDCTENFPLIKVWAPGVKKVVLNGKEKAFRRKAEFILVSSSNHPFLELPGPAHRALFAGLTSTVGVRVWNTGRTALRGRLSVGPADGWESLVRSQGDWWGGVVNLRALHKGSMTRRISPERFQIDAKRMTFVAAESCTVPPGGSRLLQVVMQLPSDVPPASQALAMRFGGITQNASFTVKPPVTTRTFVPNLSRELLRVEVCNVTADDREVQVAVQRSDGWIVEGDIVRTLRVRGFGKAHVDFRWRFAGTWRSSQCYPVRVSIRTGGYAETAETDLYVAVAHRATTPPSLDGTWRGWNRERPVSIDSSSQISRLLLGNQLWKGKADLSATVAIMYDSSYLYVGADVADDSLVTHWNFPMMSYPWDTDCMEVIFDTRRGSDQRSDPPTPGLFRHLSMAEYRLTEFSAELWRGGGAGGPTLPKVLLVPRAETFFCKTEKGYALICRYPLGALRLKPPAPGSALGFDLAISDNDGTTYRKNQHIWAGYAQNQSWWDIGTIGVLLFGE